MDTDEQTKIAQQNDPVLCAKIVRDIAEVERDYRLAEGPLSQRLLDELTAVMRKAAPEPWEIITTDWSVLISSPDWKSARGLGKGDAWIELSEFAADDNDHSWIAAAVGAGPTSLGLELMFRKGLEPAADNATREKSQAAKLQQIGFKRDDTGKRVYLPIAIDRLLLSKAFGENDLAQALGPVTKAVEAIVAGKADLDALIEVVRKKGKGH